MLQSSATGRVGLRVIAAYKLVKAIALIVLGTALFKLDPSETVKITLRLVAQFRLDPDDRVVHSLIGWLSGLQPRQLDAAGAGMILYGLLFVTEGVGLFLGRRWAEYLVIVTTGLLIPLEAQKAVTKGGAVRILVLLGNLAVVAYLVWLVRKTRRKEPGRPAESGSDSETK